MAESRRPVCVFLVPLVRDSDRKSHPPLLWRLLQDALLKRFGGFTGPETVPGEWAPDEDEVPVKDLSRRYTVAVTEKRVEELRELVRRVGNSFDQRAMYFEVAGYVELLEVRPEDGFLEV